MGFKRLPDGDYTYNEYTPWRRTHTDAEPDPPDTAPTPTGVWLPRWERPGRWATYAACKGRTADMEIPASAVRRPRASNLKVETARAICHTCPVIDECLAWALTHPRPGRRDGRRRTHTRRTGTTKEGAGVTKPTTRQLHADYVASLHDADLTDPATITVNPTPKDWATTYGYHTNEWDTRWRLGPDDLDPDTTPIWPTEDTLP